MSDLTGFDAAYPPGNPPPDQVAFGYLGGDTPHVWTAAEWKAQPARFRVGIWTRSNPASAAQGTSEGRAALAAWRTLGAPAGTLIGLDLETAVNGPYVLAFDAAVVAGGCKVAAYGSKSTLFQNPRPSGGYWVADITNTPHLYPGSTITQFEFESGWDDDEVSGSIINSLWDTQGADMPLTPADVQLILNTPIPRAGHTAAGAETGDTTLGGMVAWNDAHVGALLAAAAKAGTPTVDAAALAAALAGNAGFVKAIAHALAVELHNDTPAA